MGKRVYVCVCMRACVCVCVPQSSQFVEPLWTDSGIKSEICVHELSCT